VDHAERVAAPSVEPGTYDLVIDPSNLWHMRAFYLAYPILDAVRRELSWTHYRLLLRLEKAEEIVRADKVLSKLSAEQIRSIRSEAGVMVLLEPERTLDALPRLLATDEERERVLSILKQGLSLEGITPEQHAMALTIMDRLGKTGARSAKRKKK